MMKRLLSLLLTLAILLGAIPGLAETAVPVLPGECDAGKFSLPDDYRCG